VLHDGPGIYYIAGRTWEKDETYILKEENIDDHVDEVYVVLKNSLIEYLGRVNPEDVETLTVIDHKQDPDPKHPILAGIQFFMVPNGFFDKDTYTKEEIQKIKSATTAQYPPPPPPPKPDNTKDEDDDDDAKISLVPEYTYFSIYNITHIEDDVAKPIVQVMKDGTVVIYRHNFEAAKEKIIETHGIAFYDLPEEVEEIKEEAQKKTTRKRKVKSAA